MRDDVVIALDYPSVLGLLRDPNGLAEAGAEHETHNERGESYRLREVRLKSPIPEPPTLRDFYAFEQHVRAARFNAVPR